MSTDFQGIKLLLHEAQESLKAVESKLANAERALSEAQLGAEDLACPRCGVNSVLSMPTKSIGEFDPLDC
jgi:hypothetical protein